MGRLAVLLCMDAMLRDLDWGHLLVSLFLLWDSAIVSQCDARWPGPLWGVGSHGAPDPCVSLPGPLNAALTESAFILDVALWVIAGLALQLPVHARVTHRGAQGCVGCCPGSRTNRYPGVQPLTLHQH